MTIMMDFRPNKRMQSDHPIRYANGLAADARRYKSLIDHEDLAHGIFPGKEKAIRCLV